MAIPIDRKEIIAALLAIERALDNRHEIWRAVVDGHGNVIRRIFRGWIDMRRDSRSGESADLKGDTQ